MSAVIAKIDANKLAMTYLYLNYMTICFDFINTFIFSFAYFLVSLPNKFLLFLNAFAL